MAASAVPPPSDGEPGVAETTASSLPPSEPPEPPRWRDRIHTTLEVIRANPTGRIALKVFFGVAGLLVVGLGALLIPLPGPGWLIVIGGLAIWAVEFSWARKLLNFTRRNVQSWTHWVTRQSLPVRCLLGAVGLVFVGAVVVLTVRLSFGVNLITTVLDYFAAR